MMYDEYVGMCTLESRVCIPLQAVVLTLPKHTQHGPRTSFTPSVAAYIHALGLAHIPDTYSYV